MKKYLFFILLSILLIPLTVSAAQKTYMAVGTFDSEVMIVDESGSFYMLNTGFMCPASYFDYGDPLFIDTGYTSKPSYGDTIIYERWGDYESCEAVSSDELNIREYYVTTELSSTDQIIIVDQNENSYLVEYGYGCNSMWKYEGKSILIDIGGYSLDGYSDQIYLLDDEDDCRVSDAEEIDSSYNSDSSGSTDLDWNAYCNLMFGDNVWGDANGCYCNYGYAWNSDNTACIVKSTCPDLINGYLGNDGICYCNSGYTWSEGLNKCIFNTSLYQRPTTTVIIPDVINSYIGKYNRTVYTDRPDPMDIVGAMVKGESDPATYIVDTDGKLRWIKTEAVAKRLFGDQWDSYITWFNDSIIYTYQIGETIEQ